MTTLQHLMEFITANRQICIPAERVRYGWTEVLNVAPGQPFVSFSDFHSDDTYQTNGLAIVASTFTVHVVAYSVEEAEMFASTIFAQLKLSKPTPTAGAVFRRTYDVEAVPTTDQSYRFHVATGYELHEDATN